MKKKRGVISMKVQGLRWVYGLIFFFISEQVLAQVDPIALSVWANEAIVATYTYNYNNFMQRQQAIAQYFTAKGWLNYNKAFEASKLLESIQKNRYEVQAVATGVPSLRQVAPLYWEATMPILVVYQNPQYQQKQELKVSVQIVQTNSGEGVRGFALNSLNAVEQAPPCRCMPEEKAAPST